MKKLLLFFSFLFFSNLLQAQDVTLAGIFPVWSQTGRINNKLNYNFFIATTIDPFNVKKGGVEYPAGDLNLYIQSSIIYVVNANWNIAGSYTYQGVNPFGENFFNEHRIWEQVIFSNALGKGRMTHRVRLEERFIENRATGTYPLSTRTRYQLGFNMPLQGRTLEEKEFYLNAYNEFYFNMTGAKNTTYSDNWAYVGCGYNLGKMGKLELGYLLQTSVRDKQKDLKFFNIMQIMWATNFDFFKKEAD